MAETAQNTPPGLTTGPQEDRSLASLPFKAHPIFALRRASILLSIIGLVLPLIISPSTLGSPRSILLILSLLLSVVDLLIYAVKKERDPDHDPPWPSSWKWMLGDLVLAVLLQAVFWIVVQVMNWYYGTGIVEAYAALTGFLCSLLHACAFWKELMAWYRNHWLVKLPRPICTRCGFTEGSNANPASTHRHQHAPPPARDSFESDGLLTRQHHPVDVLTPDSTLQAMEEGCLIATEFDRNGYGSISEPEVTVISPEEIIVGKCKGKKKASRSSSPSGKEFQS